MEFKYDIFLSYSSKDSVYAEFINKHLVQEGFNVWWDQLNLRASDKFEDVIEESILLSRCLVVIWSENSIKSKWVRAEANEALERDALVPVRKDNCKLPMLHKHLHAVELFGWDESHQHQSFKKLVSDIKHKIKNEVEVDDDWESEIEKRKKEKLKKLKEEEERIRKEQAELQEAREIIRDNRIRKRKKFIRRTVFLIILAISAYIVFVMYNM